MGIETGSETEIETAPKRTRGRPPKDASPDVREAILEAATDLFAEHGYAATPVSHVCDRAGVGKPAVYWHFESKQGLLAAVLERLQRRWRARLEAPEFADSPQAGLDAVLASWREMVIESSPELRLPMTLQLDPGSEANRQVASSIWREADARLATAIQTAVGRDLPGLDLLGHTGTVLIQGAMYRYELDGDVEQLDRMLDFCRRTLLLILADLMQDESAPSAAAG